MNGASLAEERDSYSVGAERPADVALVAMVLGGRDPEARASELLRSAGGLRGLREMSAADLEAGGLTRVAACSIAAAMELGRRAAVLASPLRSPLRSPSQAANYVRQHVAYNQQESFVAIGLDARQRVRRIERVAVGTLSQVEVHPREFFAPLVTSRCHSVIAAHNHPSGDCTPSEADLELTRRLAEVGTLLGVPLVDHLIVSPAECVSMAALGMIP